MEKPIIVQKYGGSSVADPDRLRLVAKRVSDTVKGNRVVVVVSAMGKTTDQLIALAKSVCTSPPRRELDMLMSSGERISMALWRWLCRIWATMRLALRDHSRGF